MRPSRTDSRTPAILMLPISAPAGAGCANLHVLNDHTGHAIAADDVNVVRGDTVYLRAGADDSSGLHLRDAGGRDIVFAAQTQIRSGDAVSPRA